MAFFSLGSGNRRAKLEGAQRFEQADCVVIKAFADLKKARYLKNQFPGISPDAAQRFERRVWDRLIDYLIKLPPLPRDQ